MYIISIRIVKRWIRNEKQVFCFLSREARFEVQEIKIKGSYMSEALWFYLHNTIPFPRK